MAARARSWFVRGRVQGVGFRRFVEREGALLALDGWARNLDDGRVEVFAQGEASALDALQGRLWEGPQWAEVRDVEEREGSARADVRGFKIR